MSKKSRYLANLATKVAVSSSLLTAISSAMAAPPSDKLQAAPSIQPSASMLKEVMEARKKFGFRHDKKYVESILTNPERYNAQFGALTGGHYATPEEVKELEIRLQVQDDAIKLVKNAKKDRDFAGMYVDQKGTLHVGYTRSSQAKALELARNSRHPGRVQAFNAGRTFAELESQKKRIVDSSLKLVDEGIQISKVAVDVKTNRVTVGVVNLDSGMRDAITARFGEVEVVDGEIEQLDINRNDTADPMRAGVRITNASGGSCTSNWKARDRDDGTLVMITAGHCSPDTNGTLGGPFQRFNQGVNADFTPRKVGISDQTTWTFPTVNANGSRSGAAPVDALRVPFLDGIGSLPWLYAYDDANAGIFSNGEEAPVGDADGAVVIGTSVCSAGQFSPGQTVGGNFKNCGTVSAVNVAQVFSRCTGCTDTFTLQNANIADYIAIPGDSGAPVWRVGSNGSGNFEAIAVGHHTGGPTGSEKFNDIDRVEDALNVDIVHF